MEWVTWIGYALVGLLALNWIGLATIVLSAMLFDRYDEPERATLTMPLPTSENPDLPPSMNVSDCGETWGTGIEIWPGPNGGYQIRRRSQIEARQ